MVAYFALIPCSLLYGFKIHNVNSNFIQKCFSLFNLFTCWKAAKINSGYSSSKSNFSSRVLGGEGDIGTSQCFWAANKSWAAMEQSRQAADKEDCKMPACQPHCFLHSCGVLLTGLPFLCPCLCRVPGHWLCPCILTRRYDCSASSQITTSFNLHRACPAYPGCDMHMQELLPEHCVSTV